MKDKLQFLQKHHGIKQQALMVWSVFGSPAGLVKDLAWASLFELADPSASVVRDEQSFRNLLESSRSQIGRDFQVRAGQLEDLLNKIGQVMNILQADFCQTHAETHEDLSGQLEDLVYEGFLLELEPGRLQHYPRYLEAMRLRLERMEQDPARDARLMSLLGDFWQRYLDHIASGAEYDENLDAYRWLLEEYRVSLFAQKLGTAQKTSDKRLEDAWRKVSDGG